MTSLLDFLDLGGYRTPSRDLELVNEYAKEAAAAFLNDSVPLNDTIGRIAKTAGLTPEVTEMVCWEANKAVHSAKFASAEDKCIDFPLADARCILQGLQQGAMPKTASQAAMEDFDSDYMRAPGESFHGELSKTASDTDVGTPLKWRAFTEMGNLQKTAARLQDDLVMNGLAVKNAELEFIKAARAELLQDPLHERPKGFEILCKAAYACGMDQNQAGGILRKLAAVLLGQGLLEKTAAVDQYVSDEIARTCQVIDGNHRLYKLLSTLKSEYDRREMLKDRYNSVQTEQSILNERIRLL